MKKLLLLILSLIAFSNIGYSQHIEFEKLDAYFNTLTIHNKFMGSVAVFKNGEIIYNNQFGFSDVDTQIKPNKRTKYRVGSISKTFTAVMVFKAVEQGKMNLSETLDVYFPSIKNANQITIANLLNHRSGIHSFTDNKDNYLSYHTQNKGEKEMVALISKFDSDFEPNSKASYSNSNYLLLSYILEKVYDKNFGEILKDKISIPLELTDTYYSEYLSIEKNEANSYVFNKKSWKEEPQTNGTIGLGAGSIVSTPADLIKFSKALFTTNFVQDESLKKMKTIQDNFGMGLFQTNYFDTISFGHNGGIDGFVSMFRYFPEDKMAFVVTSNGLDYDFNAIETVLAKTLFNKHFDLPVFSTYEHSSKELNLYLGTYSSKTFPVKINVTKSKKQLILKVAGQKPILPEAFEKGKFKFEAAGMFFEFFPEKNEMSIEQGGKTNVLKRQ